MNISRHLPRTLLAVLFSVSSVAPLLAADEKAERFSLVEESPDGKFVFRRIVDGGYGVDDGKTDRKVAVDRAPTVEATNSDFAVVWAPDSRHFAVNGQIGSRYRVTDLFVWTGKNFALVPSVEKAMDARLEVLRQAQRKRLNVSAKTSLRRIDDTFKTVGWVDGETVQVLATSTRSVTDGSGTTPDIEVALLFTLKLDKRHHAQIVAEKDPPKKMLEE